MLEDCTVSSSLLKEKQEAEDGAGEAKKVVAGDGIDDGDGAGEGTDDGTDDGDGAGVGTDDGIGVGTDDGTDDGAGDCAGDGFGTPPLLFCCSIGLVISKD